MRIALCIHVFDTVDFDVYFNHLFLAANWGQKYDLVFVGKKGLHAAQARNRIIDKCYEQECTHAFFLDGDHLLTEHSLDYLVECADEAMVSGLVCKKGEQYQQVAWEVHGVDGKDNFFQVTLPLDGRVYEVSTCAFGCTLINLQKLKKLKKPYFRDTCLDGVNIRSDINLCKMFRDIGEKMFVDTRVLVGHLGQRRVVYPQNAEYYNQTHGVEMDQLLLRHGQVGDYFDSRRVSP